MAPGLDPTPRANPTGGASTPPVAPAGESSYWRRRERAALALAEQAADPPIARIYLAMAERYAALAQDAG